MLGQLNIHIEKNKVGPIPHTIHPRKMGQKFKCKIETIKVVEDNMRNLFYNL